MKTSVIALLIALCVPFLAFARSPLTQAERDFAIQVTDTLQQRLFALLLDEFANTTPQNAPAGTKAISLVFSDSQRNFRLVGTLDPLGLTAFPQDRWEVRALRAAMNGQNVEEFRRERGKWFLRRSISLSNFDPSCVLCHSNFGPPDNAPVGALMLRVPVR